jgi:hypothetical protein
MDRMPAVVYISPIAQQKEHRRAPEFLWLAIERGVSNDINLKDGWHTLQYSVIGNHCILWSFLTLTLNRQGVTYSCTKSILDKCTFVHWQLREIISRSARVFTAKSIFRSGNAIDEQRSGSQNAAALTRRHIRPDPLADGEGLITKDDFLNSHSISQSLSPATKPLLPTCVHRDGQRSGIELRADLKMVVSAAAMCYA